MFKNYSQLKTVVKHVTETGGIIESLEYSTASWNNNILLHG
jgi:hypothetical protein